MLFVTCTSRIWTSKKSLIPPDVLLEGENCSEFGAVPLKQHPAGSALWNKAHYCADFDLRTDSKHFVQHSDLDSTGKRNFFLRVSELSKELCVALDLSVCCACLCVG